jgi:hypothetical protein
VGDESYRPRRAEPRQLAFHSEVELSPLGVAFPALWSELTCTQWEDGTARDTSSLTIFLQDGWLKGCLRDKGNDRVAFVSGDSLEKVLEGLNEGLSDDTLDWRRDREKGPRRPKGS